MTDTVTRYNMGPAKGEKGEKGDEGKQGEQGLRGEALTYNMLTPEQKLELKGATGPAGMDGENGATFTPSVNNNGDLSWSNDKGLPNPSTVNIKGETGATGPQGIQGVKGDKGDKGDTGAVYTPSINNNGDLSWTNNGGLTNPNTVNIKGPKGDTGNVQIDTMFVTNKSNLPSVGDTGVLYFVLVRSTDSENKFDEYIWDDDNSNYELVGGGTVDLTNYYNKTEIDNMFDERIGDLQDYLNS